MIRPRSHNQVENRVKAGALYYALFISIIGSIVTLMVLLSSELNRLKLSTIQIDQRLEDVLESGINIYKYNPEVLSGEDSITFNPIEDLSNYHFTIVRKPWGIFELVNASAKYRSKTLSKNLQIGEAQTKENDFCLYLPDNNDYLLVGGRSSLIGNAYFPRLGAKKANMDPKEFANESIIAVKAMNSKSKLPEIDSTLLINIKDLLGEYLGRKYQAEVYNFNELSTSPIENSFLDNPIIFYSKNEIYLSGQKISGNIIVKSSQSIIVDKDFITKDIILVAPMVIIADEFQGNLQIFSSDTILIGDRCKLSYPSSLVVHPNVNTKPFIQIGINTNIQGGIIITGANRKTSNLYISEHSVVDGIVYSPGLVEHRGTINGTLYLEEFEYHSSKTYYRKHLINANINKANLDSSYVGFAVGKTTRKEIIKYIW